MAVYHLSIKNGSKGKGGAHANYIEREGKYTAKNIGDSHLDYISRNNKYSSRDDLVKSVSGNMPKWAENNSSYFWKCADKYERKNGRVYREIELSIPRELNNKQREELAQQYVDKIVGKNHPYTYAIHNPKDRYGEEQPHIHFMFSERTNDGINRSEEQYFKRANPNNPELGGAKKNRDFNKKDFVLIARREWANTANNYLKNNGYTIRIDERSYKDRGIDLKSQNIDFLHNTKEAELAKFREIAKENGNKIISNPNIVLQALTSKNSTFTEKDLHRFLSSHTDGEKQFQEAYLKVKSCNDFKILDDKGTYTTNDLYKVEKDIINKVEKYNNEKDKSLSLKEEETKNKIIKEKGFTEEQKKAFELMTNNKTMSVVNGSAGTGKSYVLSGVNNFYEQNGAKVYGISLQAITAQNMHKDIGIKNTSTAHSFLARVNIGKISLDKKSVVIVDEASMIGSHQMQDLIDKIDRSGAKIRLVGDSYQLNAVSPGNAFGAIQEKLKKENQEKLETIIRQKDQTMCKASEHFAKHDIGSGLDIYKNKFNAVHNFTNQDEAMKHIVEGWKNDNSQSKIMLAYTNQDVDQMNEYAREHFKNTGKLAEEDHNIRTHIQKEDDFGNLTLEEKYINISEGEKIIFRKNDKNLGVVNGEIGQIQKILKSDTNDEKYLSVKVDDRNVFVDLSQYDRISHGYASTIHKSQGITVDSSHVLLSKNMNANLAYVSMTRHRYDLNVAYSDEQFKNYEDVKTKLNRPEEKTFTGNYEDKSDKNINEKLENIDKDKQESQQEAKTNEELNQEQEAKSEELNQEQENQQEAKEDNNQEQDAKEDTKEQEINQEQQQYDVDALNAKDKQETNQEQEVNQEQETNQEEQEAKSEELNQEQENQQEAKTNEELKQEQEAKEDTKEQEINQEQQQYDVDALYAKDNNQEEQEAKSEELNQEQENQQEAKTNEELKQEQEAKEDNNQEQDAKEDTKEDTKEQEINQEQQQYDVDALYANDQNQEQNIEPQQEQGQEMGD